MSPARRCGATLRPLLVLCVMALCSASQQQPSASLNITPDELWRLIDQAVKAATQPLIIKLDARTDTLDSRLDVLDSKVDGLTVHLHKHDSQLADVTIKLDNQKFRLDGLATQLDNQISRLDEQATQLNNQKSRLDGQATQLNNQKSRLNGLATQLDNQKSRLDGQLNDQKSRLDGQETQLNNHKSRLDGLATQLDNQKSRLDGQLNNQKSRLDRQETQLNNQKSRLDRQETQLNNQKSRLDGQSSQLNNQKSRLDKVVAPTDSQQTQIDGMTIRLNRTQTESGDLAAPPRDCSDLPAGTPSGVHLLQPGLDRSDPPVPAYCDLATDGGNWTVIQRRDDIQPRQEFYLGWQAYKEGFGELDAEFWWGLEHIWAMTSPRDRRYELRINLEDFDGETRHAVYQGFRVSSEEDGYRLAAVNYTGDAGDSLKIHSGRRFTTKDRDHDTHLRVNCAQHNHSKAGWWYQKCWHSNLNGRYLSGLNPDQGGLAWKTWRGWHYSLKTAEMKIRPIEKFTET